MIARVWRGVVARERQADYVAYMDDTGVAEYRRAPGCRLSMILTRDLDPEPGPDPDPDPDQSAGRSPSATARAEVTAFSIWDDEAAIQAFAGPDITAMVLYPEDREFLLEPPTLVHHQVHGLYVPAVPQAP